MTGPLERRYRMLLACYPAGHRQAHAEEMLGALLAGARPGQRWPGLAESADLIWGALRIRAYGSLRGTEDPGWRDALAVFSVAAPLLMLILFAVTPVLAWWHAPHAATATAYVLVGGIVQGRIVLVVLVLLRLRRTAALLAAGWAIWLGAGAVLIAGYDAPSLAFLVAYFGLESAALFLTRRPRRGLRLLTWRRGVLLVIAGTAVAALSAGRPPVFRYVAIVVLITAIALTLASPLGRRVLALAAMPAYPFALAAAGVSTAPGSGGAVLIYLPVLLVTGLVLVRVRQSARARPGSHDPAG